MNKEEFVAYVADENECSKADAKKALNMITASILKALQEGKEINLVGFGSFSVQKRLERDGHNPKTGERIRIPA